MDKCNNTNKISDQISIFKEKIVFYCILQSIIHLPTQQIRSRIYYAKEYAEKHNLENEIYLINEYIRQVENGDTASFKKVSIETLDTIIENSLDGYWHPLIYNPQEDIQTHFDLSCLEYGIPKDALFECEDILELFIYKETGVSVRELLLQMFSNMFIIDDTNCPIKKIEDIYE